MPKVIFFFAGTGDPGDGIAHETESEIGDEAPEDVIRVYLRGCQDPNIGGKDAYRRMISPNLEVGADNILTAFNGF